MQKIKLADNILILILITVCSGAVRKWVVDSSVVNNVILFVQFLYPFWLYFSVNKKEDKNLVFWLFSYGFVLLFFALNPLNLTLIHGILGILIHSVFWLMLFAHIQNSEILSFSNRFINTFLVIAVVEIGLASIQYVSSASDWVNRYAVAEGAESSNSAFVGDAVRATGSFSYIAGYSSFMFFYQFFVLFLLKTKPKSPWNVFWLIFGLYGTLLSGSRGALVIYVTTTILFLVLEKTAFSTRKTLFRNMFLITGILIVNFLFNDPYGITSRFERTWDNFLNRWTSNSSEGEGRVFGVFDELINNNFEYSFIGAGLGSTYQGANAIAGTSPIISKQGYEGELFRLFLEGGWGLVVFRFVLLAFVLSRLRFSIFFKIYLFILIGFYTMLVYNIYNSIFIAISFILLDSTYNKKREQDENSRLPIR